MANRSSSITVQTHEMIQTLDEMIFKGVHEHTNELSDVSFVILTKCFSTTTTTMYDVLLVLMDVPIGLHITHFPMFLKNETWVEDVIRCGISSFDGCNLFDSI